MFGVKIKPFSVNDAWKGKRYKTDEYKKFYAPALGLLLPNIEIPDGNLKLTIEWGFSSKTSDIDNPLKPFIDVLQTKYDFNDNRIYELNVTKKICRKGAEYILFNIEAIKVYMNER